MFVLKNGQAPELSGANYHVKLSNRKRLLKYLSTDVSTILANVNFRYMLSPAAIPLKITYLP